MKDSHINRYKKKIDNYYTKKNKYNKNLTEKQNLVMEMKKTYTFEQIGKTFFNPPITRQRVQQIYKSAEKRQTDQIIKNIILEIYNHGKIQNRGQGKGN